MPKPAHEAQKFRFFYLPAFRLSGQLANRFDQAEKPAGGAGLADRKLAAGRIQREAAVAGEAMLAHERRASPLAQKPRSSSCMSEITG